MHIFIKMEKKLAQEIIIPEGIETKLEGTKLTIKGPEGENSREFDLGNISFKIQKDKIILSHERATKKEKRIINTTTAHLKNMIKGVQKKFEYELKICSSHFPITVKIKEDKATIKNFLGEKYDREISLPKDVEIKIDKDIIKIVSTNKEHAGQAAANFETVTKIKNRDKRIFQDGIYIINKAGREI